MRWRQWALGGGVLVVTTIGILFTWGPPPQDAEFSVRVNRRCRGGCTGVTLGLLAMGDAITLGTGLSPTFPDTVASNLGLVATNAGVAGDTVSAMKTRYDASYNRSKSAQRCMFLGGTVDLLDGGTAAATYTTASALLDEMRANGCSPLVVLPLPFKSASGWTVPRQSEFDVYRLSLQAYCNAHLTDTTCVDTYFDMGNHEILPKLNGSYDPGSHVLLNQAGANALATLVSRGVTSGTALYNSGSVNLTTTNPLPPTSKVYCLVVSEAPNADWTVNQGDIGLGTFNTPNDVSLYRTPASEISGGWTVWFFDPSNTSTFFGSGGSFYPTGYAALSRHVAAVCANNGTATFWVDGINTNSNSSIPTNQSLGSVLNTGTFTYPSTGGTLTNVCIAGPSGVTSADVTVAVQNSCGQFRVRNQLPVIGGVLPASGALVMAAFGDSITEKGSSVMRPWPQKLNALLGSGYYVINDGHSGHQIADMKTLYDGTYHGHGSISRCLFLGGINDIFIAGRTGAATYTLATGLLDEMRADGCRPVVVLPTPAKNNGLGWTSGKQTEYDAYRTSLAGYCVTNAATTTCVDTYGAGPSSGLGDGASPPQLYSTFDAAGDHTHPSQSGEDEIAQLVYAGVTWP